MGQAETEQKFVSVSGKRIRDFTPPHKMIRGAQKLMGENQKLVKAEFSTIN